jgi:hypothetical protein
MELDVVADRALAKMIVRVITGSEPSDASAARTVRTTVVPLGEPPA